MITACSDWTELEPKYAKDLTQTDKSEEYYEALRAYKQSDHAVAFGWYGNATGIGVSLENCLAGLPDSVDFVSLWGGWKGMTPEVQRPEICTDCKGYKGFGLLYHHGNG